MFARLSRIIIPSYASYVVVIAAVLAAYANVYRNDFVFDDLVLIKNNQFLTSWRYAGTLFATHLMQDMGYQDNFYRPLQSLLYLGLYQTVGRSTVAFHLLNIALHTVNACLLYTLGIRLRFQRMPALLAALIWALHPVQTEAVTYMSGTADPLCGVFMFAALVPLAAGFSLRRVIAACPLFALALLSKETAVVFPLLAMGLIFYQADDRWSWRPYLKTWPFWLLTFIYLALRATMLNFNGAAGLLNSDAAAAIPLLPRFYTFLATLPAYLEFLLWPDCLHMERSFTIYGTMWTSAVIAGFILLTMICIVIVWRPRKPATPLAWGLLWAAAAHIPQAGVLIPINALIYEHWLYLPAAGLLLGSAETLARRSDFIGVRKFRPALAGIAMVLVFLCGWKTFQQNRIWQDSVTLYTHIFACGEESTKARNNLGIIYVQKGQYALAIEQFRRAVAFDGNNAQAHYNLGRALINADPGPSAMAESAEQFNRAIECDPDLYQAYDALAVIEDDQGNQAKASEDRAKAAAIREKGGIE